MAFSASKVSNHVAGNIKVIFYDLNFASVTEGKVSTGLNNVLHASFENETTEAQGRVFKNNSDASTTSAGDVFIDGVTASDLGSLVVFGT
jgi:hypothetical protein